MHARSRLFALLPLLALLAAFQPGAAQAQQAAERPHLTLEDIHASSTFSGSYFRGGRWADEGPVVYYVDREDDATHLVSYNLETDERTRVIDGTTLQAPDVDRLIRIEDYQIQGDQVLLYTDSERVWRLNTKGYYYLYDLGDQTLTPIADRDDGFQMFAKLSPDGDEVAFVRDRDLYVVDLATMKERALTTDGTEGGIINGTSDWVYEEEFGVRDAWRWSPDGERIAFLKLDETNTRDFVMADLRGQYPAETRFRYPKAGEVNSEVQVGVVEVASGDVRTFDTDTWNAGGEEHEYIPQLGWTPVLDGTSYVWMFRLNRDQNQLDLLYGHPETGALTTVLEEESATWLDVETGFSDLDVGTITYLDDDAHFVWISERDGFRHLYLYENDGTLVRQITDGDWEVAQFHGIDEAAGEVYVTGTKAGPTQRQLYRAPLDGSGTATRITEQEGWHGINMSGDLRYYIDTFSDAATPAVTTLHRADGTQLKVLESNAELIAKLGEYDLPVPEFIEVPAADGELLNAWIMRPSDFDETRAYPVLMYVYGGPGSQTVRNAWGGSRYLWHAYLADELGMIVVSVDNRGTGARGRAFKTATYKQLGQLEALDQIAAAQHLASFPFVDRDRIGIWGWSYGGFMTLMSMLYDEGPETFRAGVAVAPVTDWRQYDTIYTERYMSTPQHNPQGYDEGAPINYADRMRDEQNLLLIHGDLDDNVHFQNAIQMVEALQDANKQFTFMVYPGRNHGIYGGNARLHLFTLATEYLENHLVNVPAHAAPETVEMEPAGGR